MELMNKGNHSEAAENRRQDCSRLRNDEHIYIYIVYFLKLPLRYTLDSGLYRRRNLNQANEFCDYLGHISLQLLVSESLKLLIAA